MLVLLSGHSEPGCNYIPFDYYIVLCQGLPLKMAGSKCLSQAALRDRIEGWYHSSAFQQKCIPAIEMVSFSALPLEAQGTETVHFDGWKVFLLNSEPRGQPGLGEASKLHDI